MRSVELELQRQIDEALRHPVIPENRREAKARDLGDAEMRLYGAILAAFPQLGGPPDDEWLRVATTTLEMDHERALDELVQHDLIALDPQTGTVQSAYPYSGEPTPQLVHIDGAFAVYAMCALDALGIAFMAGRDTKIISSDAATGEPIGVEVRGGTAASEPSGIVVFVGTVDTGGTAADDSCPLINFFRSEDSATRFLQDHREARGSILSLDQALELARHIFGVKH